MPDRRVEKGPAPVTRSRMLPALRRAAVAALLAVLPARAAAATNCDLAYPATCAGYPDRCDRPMFPALFLTDITTDPASRAGDWQTGGSPIAPHAVFGTWKAAVRTVDNTKAPAVVTVTPDADPAQNHWNL